MSGEPHLKLGDTGEWVQHAQMMLEVQGFPIGRAVDGHFDQATHDQVVAFQEHHQIHPPNGEVGEHTWAALDHVQHIQGDVEHEGGRRTGEDMQHIRGVVIDIAKRWLEFHFHEVTRAASDFHQHASDEAQMIGTDPEPDVFAVFDAATTVFGFLFPEAELSKLVAEIAIKAFKAGVDVEKQASVSAQKRDILSLAKRLSEATSTSATGALTAAEGALNGPEDPATAALMKLDQLPQVHEHEWLEYTVSHYLGIPNPVTHSPYLYVREPLEEKLAEALAKQKFDDKYGTPSTPFWHGQEENHIQEARIGVEVQYERKGWHEPEGEQHHQH
jgi:hypothetical protein